jgi:subtilisin family serine protease
VIVKFNDSTEDLEALYNIKIDRSDEATPDEIALIRKALPSIEDPRDRARQQPVMGFRRVFESVKWDEMQALKERASQHAIRHAIPNDPVPPMPALETYFRIDFKEPRPTERLTEPVTWRPNAAWHGRHSGADVVASALRGCDRVDDAYVGCRVGVPPATSLSQRCRLRRRYQRSAADVRVSELTEIADLMDDPIHIWEFKQRYEGYEGDDSRFVDIEQGWELDHPALPNAKCLKPLSGVNRTWMWSISEGKWVNTGLHGLMVLGIISANDGLGIVPDATPYIASEWTKPDGQPWAENTADAIMAALQVLQPGDVILIEGQQVFDGVNLPVEADPLIFQAIVAAYHLGITVVEAAGNNLDDERALDGYPLDTVWLPNGQQLFAQDSGAILVAASSSDAHPGSYVRRRASNYGTRVNCFADGESILALDSPGPAGEDPGNYAMVTGGGTSSAAATIAGVALLIQGLARRRRRECVYHPLHLRELLSDDSIGTLPDPSSEPIGVMPDLIRMDDTYTIF